MPRLRTRADDNSGDQIAARARAMTSPILVESQEASITDPRRSLARDLPELAGALMRSDAVEERWSARRTLAFVLVTCGAFWGLVAAAVIAIV